MSAPAYAPASVRNSGPILGVLVDELDPAGQVLEIGSGTGYHAVCFARALPRLSWQTSDLAENLEQIATAVRESGLDNVKAPIALDTLDPGDFTARADSYDAVYTSNTAHIMPPDAVRGMLSLAGCVLRTGGRFLVYGPFRRGGEFSTPSNAGFDRSLREQNGHMGIRDFEWVDRLAVAAALRHHCTYAMPANNLLIVWQKTGEDQ